MNPPLSRRDVLAIGSVVGSSLLAGCEGSADSGSPQSSAESETADGDESLGLAYSESHASYPSEGEVHSGWVHIVSDGESADLTFDVRFCRTLGAVEPALTRGTANEYVLRFAVDTEFGRGTPSSETTERSSCSSVTRLVGGANVPSDWETLAVAVNDTELRTVERSGTMPELRPLPDPVRPR